MVTYLRIYVIDGKQYDIVGCWDKETPEDEYDGYDIYDDGHCVNEGNMLYEIPTRDEVKELLVDW